MKSEWPLVQLKDVTIDIGDGLHGTPKYENTGGYYFINGSNFKNGKIELNNSTKRVSQTEFEKHKKNLNSNTILVSINGTLGNVALYNGEPVILGKSACYLNVSNKVDKHFLRFVLDSELFQNYISNLATGSTIKNVSLRLMREFSFKLPPYSVQVEISKNLKALDDRISLLRETNTTLEAIAQALFKSWFIDFDPVHAKMQGQAPQGMDEATAALFPDSFEESELGPIPKGWEVKKLTDIVDRITKGTTPTTIKKSFTTQGVNFIKAESMTDDGNFITGKFSFIDNETNQILKRSQLQEGDVLISIAGTIGRSAVISGDLLPANTNQAVALIRPKNNLLPSSLLWRFLKQERTMQEMRERVVHAVQANLSLGTLSNLTVAIPSADITTKFVDLLFLTIDKKKLSNTQKINSLVAIRDTLLPQLIAGKISLNCTETTN